MLLFLLLDNSILPRSLIRPPVITLCMFCRFRYGLFWIPCFSFYGLHFFLPPQSLVLLVAQISVWCLHCPIWKTRNHWYCIDAHFQDGSWRVLQLIWPPKAANISSMDGCNQSGPWLPKWQFQNWLTLRWHPFAKGGSDRVTLCIACQGCQYVGYA